jgi:mRNA interferase RelE/StbE
MFSVEWSEEAVKQLKKLDKTIANYTHLKVRAYTNFTQYAHPASEEAGVPVKFVKRIVDKTDNIKDVPHHFLERMVGTDLWKLRIGDYRVLIQIEEKDKMLFVVTIGHRKNVYKNV